MKKVESVEQTMKKFEMLIDDFTTKQEQLDQFKQNDEKEYEDDEWKLKEYTELTNHKYL